MIEIYKNVKFDKTTFSLLVYITNKCNYTCNYCCEKYNIFGNKNLNLSKLYDFILFIYNTQKFKKYYIELYGGEPTLHPDLYDFCKKIYNLDKNIEIQIDTNFSADILLYKKLLELNIKFLISYHHSQVKFDFEQKFKQIKKFISNISCLLMYEQNNIKNTIDMYYKLTQLFNDIQTNIQLNLIHSTQYYKSNYTHNELSLFKNININKQTTHIQYFDTLNNNIQYITVEQQSYVLNFLHWMCTAGKNSLTIDYDGIIYPCEELHGYIFNLKNIDINLQNRYISKYTSSIYTNFKNFQLKSTLCPITHCAVCNRVCIKNIFNKINSINNTQIKNFSIV